MIAGDAGVGPPADDEAGDGDDQGAQGGGRQVSQGSPDEHGGSPHGQGPEAVDDAAVEVGAQPDRGAHRRGGEVQREQAGDGEVGVAAAAGQDDPGAEHVDEQQREQHRLDGDVGELQRLARDVHEVAAGEHEDIGEPPREAVRSRRPQDRGGGRERGERHDRATSRSVSSRSPCRRWHLRGAAGEREEHVVERGLMDLHVVDGDPGGVEGAHDRGGQPAAAAHRRPQPAPVVAHVHGAGHERLQGARSGGIGLAERDLEPGSADLRLELGRRAARRST